MIAINADGASHAELSILNPAGKIVLRREVGGVSSVRIPTVHLSAGVYIVRLRSAVAAIQKSMLVTRR